MDSSDPNLRRVYPFPPRNLDLEEFYRQKDEENWAKRFKRPLNIRDYTIILAIIVGSLVTMIAVLSINKGQDIRSRADTPSVNFFLFPKQIEVTAGNNFTLVPKIVNSTGKNITSLNFTLGFDNQSVSLVSMDNDSGIFYEFTPVDMANSTGRAEVFLESEEIETDNPAVINLPSFVFRALKPGETAVNFITREIGAGFADMEKAKVTLDSPVQITVLE